MSSPGYEHDCEDCEFLGFVSGTHPRNTNPVQVVYDLYYCKNCDGGTVIARYGSKGPQYSSCPISMLSVGLNPALLWARALLQMREMRVASPVATP